MRKVIAMLFVDDDKAIADGLGTLDYLEKEFGWLEQSGVFMQSARILDADDKDDANAIEMTNKIFEEE